MKKLLLILLCLPMIGIGQARQYGSIIDASELCSFFRGSNFTTYKNADLALEKILNVTGMSKRFVLMECNNISNCLATSYKGIRYILYNRDFMDAVVQETNSWSNLNILAHEIGHHVNGHSLDLIIYASEAAEGPTLAESRQMELEADEFSGFVMFKLGASLSQAQQAVNLVSTNDDDSYSTHPSKSKRLRAIEKGYKRAERNLNKNKIYEIEDSKYKMNAEEYFYLAYNSYGIYNDVEKFKIDNYTKCLQADTSFIAAYLYRGNTYSKLENYDLAISDYTRAIEIDSEYATAYYNRGNTYSKLENYDLAISDYTRAIEIDPQFELAYANRGLTYYYLKKPMEAISDYTKSIEINPNNINSYINRGLAYHYGSINYEKAISDYTSAIKLDSDNAAAYQNRGDLYSFLTMVNGQPFHENAIKDFTTVIKIEPNNYKAFGSRAFLYNYMSKFENALADYTTAININREQAGYYSFRSNIKKKLNLEYCSDLKKACEINTQFCNNYQKSCLKSK